MSPIDQNSGLSCSLATHLLLGSDVTVMAALPLPTVVGLGWQLDVTLSANHLIGLVLSGEGHESWLDLDLSHAHASSESEHEMESGLLLDVVVGKGSSVLQLLSSEDESLLVWGNTFFILDLSPINKLTKVFSLT